MFHLTNHNFLGSYKFLSSKTKMAEFAQVTKLKMKKPHEVLAQEIDPDTIFFPIIPFHSQEKEKSIHKRMVTNNNFDKGY